ncbi:hypothetical protein ACRAWB_12270 [Leifsonia poae]|uniref:hypothetical protein n=1 Tax=Leifsonia poae TaxID=110933 RepID=UPI003D69FDB0
MGLDFAFGLLRLAPVDNPATVQNHEEVGFAILLILGMLLVLVLIGLAVSMIRQPERQLDEWEKTGSAPPPRS